MSAQLGFIFIVREVAAALQHRPSGSGRNEGEM